MEIRCCCTPENLIGHLPAPTAFLSVLPIRELEDGTFAYSSEERRLADIQAMPGFEPPAPIDRPLRLVSGVVLDAGIHKKGGKGKTWKKKRSA